MIDQPVDQPPLRAAKLIDMRRIPQDAPGETPNTPPMPRREFLGLCVTRAVTVTTGVILLGRMSPRADAVILAPCTGTNTTCQSAPWGSANTCTPSAPNNCSTLNDCGTGGGNTCTGTGANTCTGAAPPAANGNVCSGGNSCAPGGSNQCTTSAAGQDGNTCTGNNQCSGPGGAAGPGNFCKTTGVGGTANTCGAPGVGSNVCDSLASNTCNAPPGSVAANNCIAKNQCYLGSNGSANLCIPAGFGGGNSCTNTGMGTTDTFIVIGGPIPI